MELPFQLSDIRPQQGFFPVSGCYGIHVNTPRPIVGDTEVESFESPLFVLHQISCMSVIQAYVIEPFYRYLEAYHNVLVLRRIKAVRSVQSPVKVSYSLGSLAVVTDEDNSVAIFCVDTSSRPIT